MISGWLASMLSSGNSTDVENSLHHLETPKTCLCPGSTIDQWNENPWGWGWGWNNGVCNFYRVTFYFEMIVDWQAVRNNPESRWVTQSRPTRLSLRTFYGTTGRTIISSLRGTKLAGWKPGVGGHLCTIWRMFDWDECWCRRMQIGTIEREAE